MLADNTETFRSVNSEAGEQFTAKCTPIFRVSAYLQCLMREGLWPSSTAFHTWSAKRLENAFTAVGVHFKDQHICSGKFQCPLHKASYAMFPKSIPSTAFHTAPRFGQLVEMCKRRNGVMMCEEMEDLSLEDTY